jgi:hypothetical protein
MNSRLLARSSYFSERYGGKSSTFCPGQSILETENEKETFRWRACPIGSGPCRSKTHALSSASRGVSRSLPSPDANSVDDSGMGLIETSIALAGCVLVLAVAIIFDRRPILPGKPNLSS